MTENTDDLMTRIENRVRGLLAKAESTEYPEEAHALSAKAEALIAQHGIDVAMLHAAGEVNDEIASRFVNIHPPYSIDGQLMFFGLARALNCRAVSIGKFGKVRKMQIFGYQSDLDRFMILWNSLRNQVLNLVAGVQANINEAAKTARCNFYAGFRHRVIERITETEQVAVESATGGALVVYNRTEAVSEALSAEYPQLKVSRSAPKRSASASYFNGRRAADNADLGLVDRTLTNV